MKSSIRKSFLPLLFLLGLVLPLWAQNSDSSNPAPIDTKIDMGLFGLLGGSMQYSLNGKKLNSYQDFKKLIYPLQDTEASDMIRKAEDKEFIANMFYVGGVAGGLDLALAFPPVPYFHVDWLDRIATGLTAAEVVVGAGLIFDNSAEGEKFNAVQRYNKILREKNKEVWKLSPQLYAKGGGLGLSVGF